MARTSHDSTLLASVASATSGGLPAGPARSRNASRGYVLEEFISE
jgi:hypothetical protein